MTTASAGTKALLPLANLIMRGASLGARFGLALYLGQAIGYDALGTFGLLNGVSGVAPAVLGMGVSFHVNRALIEAEAGTAPALLRDRLMLSASASIAATLCAWITLRLIDISLPDWAPLGATIIALEVLAFDLHVALINLGRPVLANFLLFVRSASWVLPAVALGLVDATWRTLDSVLICWLAALIASFAVAAVSMHDLLRQWTHRTPPDVFGLLSNARRTPYIYVNDIMLVGLTYADRFIVAHVLGLAAAGVYTLHFSVTQGIYALVAAAVTQLSVRRIVLARRNDGLAAWRGVLRREASKAMGYALPMSAAGVAATMLILPAFGVADFTRESAFFVLLTIAAALKPLADLANAALYSLGADPTLAAINFLSLPLAMGLTTVLAMRYGLIGAGVAAVVLQLGLIAARAMFAAVRAGSAGRSATDSPR